MPSSRSGSGPFARLPLPYVVHAISHSIGLEQLSERRASCDDRPLRAYFLLAATYAASCAISTERIVACPPVFASTLRTPPKQLAPRRIFALLFAATFWTRLRWVPCEVMLQGDLIIPAGSRFFCYARHNAPRWRTEQKPCCASRARMLRKSPEPSNVPWWPRHSFILIAAQRIRPAQPTRRVSGMSHGV